MTWADAGQLCFDQVPLIAKNLPSSYWRGKPDWQQRVRLLFADEQRFKSEIDASMQRFSSQGIVPKPSTGGLNFLTCARFLCASDTVNILLAADKIHRIVPEPDGATDEMILRWLLVETWNE